MGSAGDYGSVLSGDIYRRRSGDTWSTKNLQMARTERKGVMRNLTWNQSLQCLSATVSTRPSSRIETVFPSGDTVKPTGVAMRRNDLAVGSAGPSIVLAA